MSAIWRRMGQYFSKLKETPEYFNVFKCTEAARRELLEKHTLEKPRAKKGFPSVLQVIPGETDDYIQLFGRVVEERKRREEMY